MPYIKRSRRALVYFNPYINFCRRVENRRRESFNGRMLIQKGFPFVSD